MSKLEYVSDFDKPFGPKGKCPWITDTDGQAQADSEFILDQLTRKNDIQMLVLTPEQKSVARGLRAVLEDNFYFVMLAENCIHGDLEPMLKMYPRFVPTHKAFNFVQNLIIRKIKRSLGSQVEK
jgi:hypothetical protein